MVRRRRNIAGNIIKEWGMFYHSNVTRTCWKFHFHARSRAYLGREEVAREYLKQLEFSHVLASTQRTRVNNTNLFFETHSTIPADEKERGRERERDGKLNFFSDTIPFNMM